MPTDRLKRRSTGGRPKGDPALPHNETIGGHVSVTEYDGLRAKAAMMDIRPAKHVMGSRDGVRSGKWTWTYL